MQTYAYIHIYILRDGQFYHYILYDYFCCHLLMLVYCLVSCAVTAMTSGGKGHPAKCLPYQLRTVLSLQSQFVLNVEMKRSIFCITQTTVPFIFCQLFIHFSSIVFLIMRLSWFNSGRFFVNLLNSKGDLSITKIFKTISIEIQMLQENMCQHFNYFPQWYHQTL